MSNYQQAPPPVIPRLSPQIRAGLAGIREAEGTTGPKAYSTAFTGVQFDNSLPHQGIVRGSRNGYRSVSYTHLTLPTTPYV